MILETRPDLGEVLHGAGHAIGLAIHEPPFLVPRSGTPLAPGMIFTVEPGLYRAGLGGIRLEDDVVVRDGAPEVLSTLPLDLVELPVVAVPQDPIKGGSSEKYENHWPSREPPLVVGAAVALAGRRAPASVRAQSRTRRHKQGNVKAVAFFGFAAANSFAQATWAGVKQAAKQAASSAKFFDPNFNAQTQVSQIQDAITSGQYQAFVIQANDGNAVIPAIQQAVKAHIAVVAEFTPIGSNYASITPPIPGVTFVGESPVHNGTELGALGDRGVQGPQPVQRRVPRGLQVAPARQRTHGGGQEAARDREQRQAGRRRRGRLHAGLGPEGRPGRAAGALGRQRDDRLVAGDRGSAAGREDGR